MTEPAAPPDGPAREPLLTDDGDPIDEVEPVGTEPDRAAGDLVLMAITAVLSGIVLAATGFVNEVALLVGVALVQAALIGCWVFGTRQPGRTGALIVGVLAAAAADCLVMVFPHGQLGTLLPVVGLAIPVLFIHELARGVVRARVVESLAGSALLVVSVVALATLVELFHAFDLDGGGVVSAVVGAAALGSATGYLVDTFAPVPRFDPAIRRGLLGVVLGGAAGAAIGYARLVAADSVQFAGGRGAFIGAATGLVAALLGVGLTFITGSPLFVLPEHASAAERTTRLRVAASAIVPLALIIPIAYMLCLAIRG